MKPTVAIRHLFPGYKVSALLTQSALTWSRLATHVMILFAWGLPRAFVAPPV